MAQELDNKRTVDLKELLMSEVMTSEMNLQKEISIQSERGKRGEYPERVIKSL